MDRGDAFTRLRRGGLPGLIAGEEKLRSKLFGAVLALVIFFAAAPTVGVLIGLAAVIVSSVAWGVVIRLRKRRAGVPLDSIEY